MSAQADRAGPHTQGPTGQQPSTPRVHTGDAGGAGQQALPSLAPGPWPLPPASPWPASASAKDQQLVEVSGRFSAQSLLLLMVSSTWVFG